MHIGVQPYDGSAFGGAKVALFLGARLVVLLRDEKPGLVYPGFWDLPGGGREGTEPPLDCVIRETAEELGLILPARAISWGAGFDAIPLGNWFFVAQLGREAISKIVLGSEGQRWNLMRKSEFLSHPQVIPHFKERLALWPGVSAIPD